MMKKLLVGILCACMALSALTALAACTETPPENNAQVWTLSAVYAKAQDLGYTGSLEEFLALIQGQDGEDGKDGEDGLSAYEIWLAAGNEGTEQDFLDSLRGTDGSDGKGIVKIEKTSSQGLTDTYTIYFTDDTTATFTVTNGTGSTSEQEGTDGLEFYALDDGTYAVGGGTTIYLSSVEIPSSYRGKPVTVIAKDAFMEFTRLKNIVIPASVKIIDEQAFMRCGALENVTLPSGLESIGVSAFSNCNSLTEIAIPDSVKSIGDSAFKECSSLQSATLPNGITEIEANVFNGCHALTEIIIPDSVKSIGNSAFYACDLLKTVTIPDSVERIDSNAFFDCASLYRLTLGAGVTEIRTAAFAGCNKLIEIYNRSALPIDGSDAVSGIYGSLGAYSKNIYTPTEGNSKLSSLQGGFTAYTDEAAGEYLLLDYDGDLTQITLPETIGGHGYAVYDYAFIRSKLTDVTLSANTKSIGAAAFAYSALKSIAIPSGVKRIEENAFFGCIALESIILPAGMEYYGANLDSCRALKSIFFSGTEEEWENLIATGLPQPLPSVTVYFYSAEQPEQEGNYWRYDKDGVTPLPW